AGDHASDTGRHGEADEGWHGLGWAVGGARPLRGLGDWRGRVLVLSTGCSSTWKQLAEFLGCVPPASRYPHRDDIGVRTLLDAVGDEVAGQSRCLALEYDESPWLIASRVPWR